MGINFPALDDLQPDTNETWDAPVLSPSAQRDSLSLSNIAVEAMIRSGPYVPSSRNTLGSIVQEIEQNPSSLVIHLPFSELEVLQVGSETETSQGARNRMGVQLTGISDELESGLPAWSPPVINENLSKQQQGGRKKRKLNTAMPASSQNPSKRSPGKSPPNSVSSLSEQSMPSAPAHDDSPDDFASGRATIHNNDGILGDQQLELRDPQWWSTASQSNIEATILYTERQELLSSQNCEDPNHSDIMKEKQISRVINPPAHRPQQSTNTSLLGHIRPFRSRTLLRIRDIKRDYSAMGFCTPRRFMCLLCRRKYKRMDVLKKHMFTWNCIQTFIKMAMDETNQENFEEFWSLLKEVNDEQRYESSDTLKDYSKTNSLTEGSSENQQLSLKSTSALAEISLKTGTQEQPESDPAAILSTHPSDTYDALMGYPLRSDVSFSIEQQPEIPSVQTITLTDVQPSTSHNHQFYDRQQWTRWDHQIQTNDQVTPLTLASDTLANQPLFSCINMSTNGASTDIIPRAERCNNDRDGNQSLDNSDNRSAGSNSPKRKDRKNYFECYFPGCTKQFGRRKDLDRHVPTHDKKNDRYLYFDCTKCGHEKRYTRKDKFDEHVRNCKGKAPQKKPSQKAKV